MKEERGRGRSNLGSSNNCHFWCFASFAYLSSELVAVTCVLSPHHPSPHRDRHSHRHRHRQLAVARSPNTACMQASTTYLPCLALPCPAAASPLSNKQQFFSLCGYLSSLSGVSNPPSAPQPSTASALPALHSLTRAPHSLPLAMSAKRRGKGQRSFGNREYSELYTGTTSVDAVNDEDYYDSGYIEPSEQVYSTYGLGQPGHGGYSSPPPFSTQPDYGDYLPTISTQTTAVDYLSLTDANYSKRGIPRHVPKQGSRKHQKASPQGDEPIVIVGQLEAPQEPDSTGEEAKQPLGPGKLKFQFDLVPG